MCAEPLRRRPTSCSKRGSDPPSCASNKRPGRARPIYRSPKKGTKGPGSRRGGMNYRGRPGRGGHDPTDRPRRSGSGSLLTDSRLRVVVPLPIPSHNVRCRAPGRPKGAEKLGSAQITRGRGSSAVPSVRRRGSCLQLALELVQKAPVGALDDQLVGTGPNHADFAEAQRKESQRILRDRTRARWQTEPRQRLDCVVVSAQ